MDAIFSLVAALSGINVALSWTLTGVAGATSVQVQRTPFGSAAWANTGAPLSPATLTFLDTPPEVGDYSYRLLISTTLQGTVVSNEANISTLAATGVVVLSANTNASLNTNVRGYTQINLSWVIGTGDNTQDPISTEVQRSLDSGAHWQHVGNLNEFAADAFIESLPTGSGSVSYRVLVSLPQGAIAAGQNNSPFITTSNVVSVSI